MQIAADCLRQERKQGLSILHDSFDSVSKMNILYHFVTVAYVIGCCDTEKFLEKLRMLHHVYGLSVLTPTQDWRTVRALAAESHKSFSDHMHEAVCMAVEEELLEQRRALVTALGLALHHLPSSSIAIIGMLSELQLEGAESIYEDSKQKKSVNK